MKAFIVLLLATAVFGLEKIPDAPALLPLPKIGGIKTGGRIFTRGIEDGVGVGGRGLSGLYKIPAAPALLPLPKGGDLTTGGRIFKRSIEDGVGLVGRGPEVPIFPMPPVGYGKIDGEVINYNYALPSTGLYSPPSTYVVGGTHTPNYYYSPTPVHYTAPTPIHYAAPTPVQYVKAPVSYYPTPIEGHEHYAPVPYVKYVEGVKGIEHIPMTEYKYDGAYGVPRTGASVYYGKWQ